MKAVDELTKNLIISDYLVERCLETNKRIQELWEDSKVYLKKIEELNEKINI